MLIEDKQREVGAGGTLRMGIKLGVNNELDPNKEVSPMNTSGKDTQG